MPVPIRSIRLQKRSSRSLDTLSGSSGEIFFDADQNTLRIYTANQANSITLADRAWVTENTFDGDYNNLTNIPTSFNALSSLGMQSGVSINEFSTDGSLGDASDTAVPTEAAVKTYVDAAIVGIPQSDITSLNNIGDVDTTTEPLTNGQLLQWDGLKWQNATVQGFTDTNTTYTITKQSGVTGVDLVLEDSDAATTSVNLVGGTGINVSINLSDEIEITNSATYAINNLTDVNISNPSINDVLSYDGSQWIASASAGGGLSLTDISVGADAAASGSGGLSYNDADGVFTYTPPDLSAYAALTAFSVVSNPAQSGGSLSYNSANGEFSFRPADITGALTPSSIAFSAGATITEFSTDGTLGDNSNTAVPTEAAVKTYVDNNAGGVSNIVDDTTPQLGGNLDLNSNNITGTGDITITGTITGTSFSSGATGAPSLTSASTITLTAPDGVTIDGAVAINGFTTEKTNALTGATGTVTHDLDTGAIFDHTSLAADFTANFTNVPTTNSRTISVALILSQGGTAYMPTAVQIDGSAQTILWQGGSAPSGTASGTDIVSFTLIRSAAGAWKVIGSSTSYS